MCTKHAKKPRPRRMLDGLPPETPVVIADVTWEFYESLVESIAEGENLRVAFDFRSISSGVAGSMPRRATAARWPYGRWISRAGSWKNHRHGGSLGKSGCASGSDRNWFRGRMDEATSFASMS
jgi:hypothetical protein